MKFNSSLSSLFNADTYILNNGDVYLKVAGTLHRIGTTADSTAELQAKASKYVYTS